jgi:type VI secretion system FHA domain protein
VISAQGPSLGAASYKVFDARGGTIGRIEGNDWILPDTERLVSSRPAVVRSIEGRFYVEDVSTNGTGLNAPQAVIPRGQLQLLNDGDRLFIGDFEVLVQILAEAAPAPAPAPAPYPSPVVAAMPVPGPSAMPPLMPSPLAAAVPAAIPAPMPAAMHAPAPPAPAPRVGGTLEDLLGGASAAAIPVPPAAPLFAPGAPAPTVGALPEHWDLTGFSAPRAPAAPAAVPAMPIPPAVPPPPAAPLVAPMAAPIAAPLAAPMASMAMPVPPPTYAVPSAAGAGADVTSLLASLGLQPQQVPPDTLSQLGQILRGVIQGLMDVLVARKQVKDHFRMAMTIIRPVENNPLKFAPSAEEALYTLFVKRNPGYLGPVEAFREAFQDLSFHQLAVLAGMRAAFFATLTRFEPGALAVAAQHAAGKKGGGLFGGGKAAYWDFYRQHYEKLTRDSEANFQQIFGEAFVRAYDDQIRKLQDANARRV